MPAIDLHAPVLGPPGRPCAACGDPLAADQRYCLSCGERRGPPRLDPVAHARARGAAGPGGAAAVGGAAGAGASAPAPKGWPLPSRRVAGAATVLVLGFGIIAGAAARPKADATLASASGSPMIVMGPAPAAPAQQPATTTPDTSAPSASSADSSTPDTSSPDTSTADTSAPDTSGTDSSGTDTPGTGDSGTGTSGTETSGTGDAGTDTSGTGDSGSGSGDTPAGGDDSSTTPAQPPFKHVWLVALTGHTMEEALADPSPMPYLAGTLRPKGLLLAGYKPALPGGLANLIGLVSGQRPTAEQRGGCPAYDDVALDARTGCVLPKEIDTLPGQLAAAGKTWRAYVEDSDAGQPPDTCRHPAPGGPLEPVMARNPYLFFHAIVDTPDCAANTAGMSRLVPDTEDADSAPSFSLVVPDPCHDGADEGCAAPAGLPAADAWLEEQLDPLLASKAYEDGGLVLVTFDAAPDVTKPIGALVISDWVEAGGSDDADYRPANLLRTLEDGFALDPLGRAKHVHPVSITKPSR